MGNYKISLIGAGSGCFSMGLVSEICASKQLSGCTVSLMDIDKKRLDAVYDLCIRYTKEIGAEMRFEKTLDRIESLKGADIVINVALTAPHSRLKEGWEIAGRYGFCFGGSYHIKYDEAFWINFYQLRFFDELTRDILTHCPGAWHLMVANPVLAGTTYIKRKYPEAKMVGLCHGYNAVYHIAAHLGFARGDVTFQAPGVNHFVWLNSGHLKERGFFEVLDEWLGENNDGTQEAKKRPFDRIYGDFYRRHRVIGVGDTLNWTGACWPWWYHADDETERGYCEYIPMEAWNGYFDGSDLAAADIIGLSGDKSRSVKDFLGDCRDDLVIPLAESLLFNIPAVKTVNLPNRGGLVPGIPEDFAVEVQALCQKDGIHPIMTDPLPRSVIAHILRDRVAPVEMELEALNSGRLDFLEELVLMDKWATSIRQARGFIDEILSLPYHSEMRAHYK